jgi:pyroglutamyl-peptidase
MGVILFTGFEAFAEWEVNPTAVAAKQIDGMQIEEHRIIGKIIPLRYKLIRNKLNEFVSMYQPDVIVLSGQGGVERIARNMAESKIPYNCGTTPMNEVLIENGKEELFTTLPIQDMFTELENSGIPVTYSDSAGLFGCNQVFYCGQHDYPNITTGFIHVPQLPEQAKRDEPFMDQDTITRALKICVEVAAKSI